MHAYSKPENIILKEGFYLQNIWLIESGILKVHSDITQENSRTLAKCKTNSNIAIVFSKMLFPPTVPDNLSRIEMNSVQYR